MISGLVVGNVLNIGVWTGDCSWLKPRLPKGIGPHGKFDKGFNGDKFEPGNKVPQGKGNLSCGFELWAGTGTPFIFGKVGNVDWWAGGIWGVDGMFVGEKEKSLIK